MGIKNRRRDAAIELMQGLSTAGIAAGIGLFDGRPVHPYFSYSPAFLQEYVENSLQEVDGTVQFAQDSEGVLRWSDLKASGYSDEANKYASKHGILDGYCFVVCVAGIKTVASIGFTEITTVSEVDKERVLDALDLATLEVLKGKSQGTLSPLVNDYLRLYADDTKEADMLHALNITSMVGVRNRRKMVLRDLKTNTIGGAFAKAVKLGMFTP